MKQWCYCFYNNISHVKNISLKDISHKALALIHLKGWWGEKIFFVQKYTTITSLPYTRSYRKEIIHKFTTLHNDVMKF
jgi:hypothetical protein